ncbi:MAG TPA: thioredoxin family protein [Pirellulales bacterium]|nr:thioredoxin family protein [Pirellulales bacterium]
MIEWTSWAWSLALVAATASPNGWMDDYGAALKAAKAERKPLLVVIEDPAQRTARFEEASLADQRADRQLLSKYKLCRIDGTTAYGAAVARAFRAQALPFTSIIDKTGSVQIFVKAGPLSETQWREALAQHQSGARPELMICST